MKKRVIAFLTACVMLCMGLPCFAYSYSYAEYSSGYNLKDLGISIYFPGQDWIKEETTSSGVTISNKANESELILISAIDNDSAWFGLDAFGNDTELQELFQTICSAEELAKTMTAYKGLQTHVSIESAKYARETHNSETYGKYDMTFWSTSADGETHSTRLVLFLTAKNGKIYIIEYWYRDGDCHFEDVNYMLNKTSYHLGEITIKVNGEKVACDTPPMAISGRTVVPIRAVAEKLGYTVSWDSEAATAIITSADGSIVLYYQIGTDYARKQINGEAERLPLDIAPFAYNGRTYLPLRSVGEATGSTVNWDADSRTVVIKK